MQSPTWDENEWEELLYAIEEHNCILMIGPDAVCGPSHAQQAQPLSAILASELAAHIQDYVATWNLDPCNLAQISHYYQLERGKNALYAKVRSFYTAHTGAQTDCYQALATLPFAYIFTSTPCPMLSEAFQHVGKSPVVERYHFRGRNAEIVPTGTVDAPLIFHLYGILEEPNSLVLTENDMLDFSKAVSAQIPPFPWNILSKLRDSDTTFLFLGFGLQYWHIRLLMHLVDQEKASYSFALESPCSPNSEQLSSTILFYQKSQCKIRIHPASVTDFIRKLGQHYTSRPVSHRPTSSMKDSTGDTPSRPKVFLCYLSDDENDALFVAEHLRDAGFQPCFGRRQDDEGEINTQLQQQIEECTYFVALQSQEIVAELSGKASRLKQQIIDFLLEIPLMFDGNGQRAFSLRAGLDKGLLQQLSYNLPPVEFVPLLVEKAEKYGILQDDRSAIVVVLEATKYFVGADKQQYCDRLIQEFQTSCEQQLLLQQTPIVREQQRLLQEIQFAIDHQFSMQNQRQFIIPVIMKPCTPWKKLEGFDPINLTRKENIPILIQRLQTKFPI